MRRVIAALIVVGLAIAIVLLWPRGSTDDPPDTVAEATTTTRATPTTDPTTPASSVTTAPGSHVVETVAEAEEILRELWFGWFEGIYNEDEDRIREVVGNPEQIERAVEQFESLEFTAAPERQDLLLSDTEILMADTSCLAVWSNIDATRTVGESNDGVFLFIHDGENWMFVSQWRDREDRWADDCQSQLP